MKILWDIGLHSFMRNFTQVRDALTARGHAVAVAICESDYPVTAVDLPPIDNDLRHSRRVFYRTDGSGTVTLWNRLLRDYLWYSKPSLRQANHCRQRCLQALEMFLPAPLSADALAISQPLQALDHEARLALFDLLALTEKLTPSDPAFDEYLRRAEVDLVLVTPLVFTQYGQVDIVKSARRLGIPVFFLVYSWDNLTTKGVIHELPDYVLVWNEHQKREAIELHGAREDQVVVTGASRFDTFFEMKPTPRADFCAARGLDPNRPIIAYLGSLGFVAPRELDVIVKLTAAIRNSAHERLRDAQLVLKPHPKTVALWSKINPAGLGVNAICGSRQSTSDQLLYDVLYHSAAAVGINTSAEIEAGIVGRPVFTVLLPELEHSQTCSIHFHYLLSSQGGHVQATTSIQELCSRLAETICSDAPHPYPRSFIESFLRPNGIDAAVAPFVADEIERLAKCLIQSRGASAGTPALASHALPTT